MSDNTQEAGKISDTRLTITLALFTLLGGLITSGVGWVSAKQTASASYRQYCLTRVDTREATIREKVDAFLVAQGNLASLSSHQTLDFVVVEQRIDTVASTGFALSSYFDGELSETTKAVALDYGDRLNLSQSGEIDVPRTDKEKHEASEQLKSDLKSWGAQYRSLLKSFEEDRSKCN